MDEGDWMDGMWRELYGDTLNLRILFENRVSSIFNLSCPYQASV
jgi:hypothetical protein